MDPHRKTIFLTVSVGMIARNLLHNDFWKTVTSKYNVVILTAFADDEVDADFIKLFGRPNVVVEKMVIHRLSRVEKLFWSLHKALMYNPTTLLRARYGLTSVEAKQKKTILKKIKNNLEYVLFGLALSKIHFLKDALKRIDRFFYHTDYYKELFDQYDPDAVFLTNISSDAETYLLRSAKSRRVYTFGMTKSWDNFSKIGFRDKVDTLIGWRDFMKDEAVKFQNYPRERVHVIGIPQFDIYYNLRHRAKREDFTSLYGLDPAKKTILFGDGGITLSPDDPYVIGVIRDWIIANQKPYQILVRPHYMWKGAYEHFASVEDKKVVFIDTFNKPSSFKRGGGWDISPEHHYRLALSMTFSDLVVTSISTLVLDGLACGNQVICYAFDKDKNLPYTESIKRLYTTLWFLDLQKYGLTKRMVASERELLEKIEAVLDKGLRDFDEEAKHILSRFCYVIDGRTGQ